MAFDGEDLITTTEAAQLINRSPNAVRTLVQHGRLRYVGLNEQRRPLLSKASVLAWYATHPAKPGKTRRPWLDTLGALRGLGPATSDELAAYLGLHPGNVRKHLRILAETRDAIRLSDGQWATAWSVARGDICQDDNGHWYLATVDDDGPSPALVHQATGVA